MLEQVAEREPTELALGLCNRSTTTTSQWSTRRGQMDDMLWCIVAFPCGEARSQYWSSLDRAPRGC